MKEYLYAVTVKPIHAPDLQTVKHMGDVLIYRSAPIMQLVDEAHVELIDVPPVPDGIHTPPAVRIYAQELKTILSGTLELLDAPQSVLDLLEAADLKAVRYWIANH